jgi:ribosome-associated protein
MAGERNRAPAPAPPYARAMAGDDTLHVHRGLDLPLSEISWRATTSGGPGGQHANRTLSRVEVQFDVDASATLGPRQRARLREKLGPVVRASSSETRSQARNRELALQRLAAKLHAGLQVDPDRRPTRPTRASKVRRVEDKRHRSQTKKRRQAPGADD